MNQSIGERGSKIADRLLERTRETRGIRMTLAAEMKTQAKYLAIQLGITLVVYFAFDTSLGYTALAVFVGWPIVGTLVTADDDLPGGWSNPDGTVRPPWITAWFWGLLALRFSVAMLAFVVERLVSTSDALPFLALAGGSAMAAVVLLKRERSRAGASS